MPALYQLIGIFMGFSAEIHNETWLKQLYELLKLSHFFGLNKFCVFYYSIFSAMFLDLRFLAMLALHKS